METKTKKRRSIASVKRPVVAPESPIYEMLDGRPLYYQGCRDLLAGHKTTEEIIDLSTLQWVLVSYYMRIMYRSLDEKRYWFASNEDRRSSGPPQ